MLAQLFEFSVKLALEASRSTNELTVQTIEHK